MDPASFRSRVFRRPDMDKRLKNVFMQFDEIENCKFEPEAGALNRHQYKGQNKAEGEEEAEPGAYFNKMGVNFA